MKSHRNRRTRYWAAFIALVCAGLSPLAFAQTTLNVSQDLVRLGIGTANIVPNQPNLDAGPLLFTAVTYAKNHQISRVIADTGSYYFRSLQFAGAHVAWDQLSNMTIDFQGSDLYFSFPLVNGIFITNGTNIVLQNFTADYNPLPFTQVRVISADAAQRRIQFAVDGGWQNPTTLNAVFTASATSFQAIEVHIFRNGRPIVGVPRMAAANPVTSTQFTVAPDPSGFANTAALSLIRPGDIAFMGMRLGSGPVNALYCTGCTFRNIAVYSSTYWGVNLAHIQSSVIDHVYSIPRPGTDRLASNYVGLFLSDLRPNNLIRLNRIIRTMDNGLEGGAPFVGTVKSQTATRTFLLEGSLTSLLSYSGNTVPNGTGVAFQRPTDGVTAGSAMIVSQASVTTQSPYQVAFTFDRDLPVGIVGTLMRATDASQSGGNSVIERNALEDETDCCNGFFLAGLSNSFVRGNYIQRSAMAGLITNNALTPSNYNAPAATNFAISGNVIDRANWTPTGYPINQLGSILVNQTNSGVLLNAITHQNISVAGNFVADSGSAGVWLGNTNDGSITGQYLLNPNSSPAVETAVASFGPSTAIVTPNSQNIAIGGNTVDTTSRRMWVTDTQYRELAAYSPGSLIRLNAYDLGTFPSPSVTITDGDSNTSPIAIEQTTAHALDVRIPASAALGGAYLTLTAGGQKYFGTLFLDAVDNIPALNGCTYEISPSATSVGGAFGSLPILVVTQDGCPYGVLAKDAFVSAGQSTQGTGIISAGFSANSGAARNTIIEIAGQPIAVTQMSQGASLASRFVPITPCRVADTRNAPGPFGGPALDAFSSRSFTIPSSACNIPLTATAFSLNVAVVPKSTLGYLTVWPAGLPQPFVATLTSPDGRVRSNAAIVPAGTSGAVSLFATHATDVVIDISGYFVPSSDPNGLAFYPLPPCRIADTRNTTGPLGGPALAAGGTRTFPITQGTCGVPGSAQAFSLNLAAVPKGPLGYLTAWPTGKPQPLAASLNAPTGTVTANAVIVPSGTNGSVDLYSTNNTDLVIDIDGYFALPGSGGLSLYNLSPCRVLDTRLPAGTLSFTGSRDVSVGSSGCGAPPFAQSYVFNATVVPPGGFGYLSLWPQGQPQPLVATLNAIDGAITSNLAIVPTQNSSISVFAANPTHLVLDIFGYFAP